MADSPKGTAAPLVGGFYAVDFSHPLADAAPPLPAFAASHAGRPGFMAVVVARGSPARSRALSALGGLTAPNLLLPLAHGPAVLPSGEAGYVVICPAPPGPSLTIDGPAWSEADLIEQLLKPVAQTLAELQSRSVTHRAIRADNLFRAGPQKPVTLGCAWAAPAGCHQPAWMEPPYSAACLPAGRGDGTTADDVYALGALMMALSLGANPVHGLADGDVLRRKLDAGSYVALAEAHHLPMSLAELLRGMLADDPDHRPSPALLANPATARARRVAAHPVRRAQRPLQIGPEQAWTARTLAHAVQAAPDLGLTLLRTGVVGHWLRRGLGDNGVATQMDAIVQRRDAEAASGNDRADPLLVTRAVALLDPAAPLVWRSLAIWPDGLGPALDHALHHAPDLAPSLAEIVTARVVAVWEERRAEADGHSAARPDTANIRHWHEAGTGGFAPVRLCYSLNPLAPCESPATARAWVIRLAELLPALEDDAGRAASSTGEMVDASMAAFVAARRDERMDGDLQRLAAAVTPGDVLGQLRLLARVQAKLQPGALPQLSRRAGDLVRPLLERYHSRLRRKELTDRLADLAQGGQLSPIAAMLDDDEEWASDKAGLAAAQARLAAVEAALTGLSEAMAGKPDELRRTGQEVAEGFGLAACLAALAFAVFG